MATLSDSDRFDVWRAYMKRTGTLGAITKQELRAAVDALDDEAHAERVAFVAALPAASQGLATADLAKLFAYGLSYRLIDAAKDKPDENAVEDVKRFGVDMRSVIGIAWSGATATERATNRDAAIAATLTYFDDTAVAWNNALPNPAKTVLTTVQKSRLLRDLAHYRYARGV